MGQISMSTLGMAYAITNKENFRDQQMLIHLIQYTQVNNQLSNSCAKELKDVLDQEEQLINVNKQFTQPATLPQPSTNLQEKK